MGKFECPAAPSPEVLLGDGASPSPTTTPTAADSKASPEALPSDRQTENSHSTTVAPPSTEVTNNNNNNNKKTVRINDEITLIPLLTSASFFQKTPKPTTITGNTYGIMPSFRIVTSAAISSIANKNNDNKNNEDDLVPKSSLWWTREERLEILVANQRASRDFKRFQPTLVRKANLFYNEIVTECCCNHCDTTDDEYDGEDSDQDNNNNNNDIYVFFQRERRRNNNNNNSAATKHRTFVAANKKRKRTTKAVSSSGGDYEAPSPSPELSSATIDLPTSVRGLEWGVMPDAKRYRKAHARTILRLQERFRRTSDRRRQHEDDPKRRRLGHDCERDGEAPLDNDQRQPQDVLLGRKACVSSLRSCLLARVFGNSDATAAYPSPTVSDIENHRRSASSSRVSPTPSLTGTTDESESGSDESESGSDESEHETSDTDDGLATSESEIESDDDNYDSEDDDSDDEEDDEHNAKDFRAMVAGNCRHSLSSNNPNSHKRMFRPRMMPPVYWS